MALEETFHRIPSTCPEDAELLACLPAGHRVSQTITCQLLVIFEALWCGVLMAVMISASHAPYANFRYEVVCGVATAAIMLLCAFVSGSSTFDRFSSRLSLLLSAITASAFAVAAVWFAGATWPYMIFDAVFLFAGVHIGKIPTSMVKSELERRGYLSRLVAVASSDPALRVMLVKQLRKRPDIKIVFTGSPAAFDKLSLLTQQNQLDEIVLSGHEAQEENVAALAGLAVMVVRVTPQDRLDRCVFDPRWGQKRVYSPWAAPAAVIAKPPLKGWRGGVKRCMDFSGAIIGIIVLSPIMLACAVAIKLESPGPAFFLQERAGYRNKPFLMIKFRSMRCDQADPTASKLTVRNDPRVTRVGAFLRRTSADELPQLINVLLGDMSLVGPRPHPKGAKAGATLYDDLIPTFYSRYRMKPGITGLAQINGLRGNTETEQHLIDRFGRDLQYAAEWTPFLDIAIMFRTVLHLFKGTNAF